MSGANAAAILENQPDLSLEQVREELAYLQPRVDELLRRYPVKRGALLQVLWLVQEHFSWVPRIGIKWAAEHCDVSPVHAFGVVEFYTMYRQAPVGRYFVQVCHNVACHIQGAEEMVTHLENKLGIHAGETTEDGLFTLVRVECLAMCGNGPGILINDEFLYGSGELNELEEGWHPTTDDVDRWLDRLRQEAADNPKPTPVDSLGELMLETKGHPGACGASGDVLPVNYAAAPPALKSQSRAPGRAYRSVVITCMCAPEATRGVVEHSTDGKTWVAVGEEIDVKAAPGVPGPPGGPKNVTHHVPLTAGLAGHVRVCVWEGERAARPSATAGVPLDPPEPVEESSDSTNE